MPRLATPLTPSLLPSGYGVGAWRLMGRCGRGSYGVVYRAHGAMPGESRRFALKLATSPGDPRFEREVELLSRIHHPHVPRLHDHGWWVHGGVAFPFLVMDWVEGVSLYTWATLHERSSRQVLRLLGQLARALEATHAAGCVHRDVKGDNVLVSPAGTAFLVDFGAGTFEGAPRLTTEVLPPSTAQYRSPQALRFQWDFRRHLTAHYEPTAADDVYALGVTAYHLVTGAYPLPAVTAEGERELQVPPPRPAGERVEVCEELDQLILRMLAEDPRARASAGEVARAAEDAVALADSRADVPITPRVLWVPAERSEPSRPLRPLVRLAASGLAAAVALMAVAISARLSPPPEVPLWSVEAEGEEGSDEGSEDGGSSGVGSSAAEQLLASAVVSPSSTVGVGLALPLRPLFGQRRPPCRPPEVELRSGCWLKIETVDGECSEVSYAWRGGCYVPSTHRPRLSTSEEGP